MADEAPNAEIAAVNQPLDPSSAAALLTRASSPAPDRGADGKFVAKQPEGNQPAIEDPAKVVDLKTGKPPEEVKAAEPEPVEDEEEEIEFPPEKEGEAPKRVKLSDVLAAYEELPKVKAEFENVRKVTPPPADYTTALQDVVQQRSKYLQGLEIIEKMVQPRDPSLEMLNPQSQHYNPDAYYGMKQKADQDRQILANIQQERDRSQKIQDEQDGILHKARVAREVESLSSAWPEYKADRDGTLQKAAEGLIKSYGFTIEDFNKIDDHRTFLVIRDALKLRALEAKQAEAVKVVRQKPKLVKGAARTTTNPQAAQMGNAMSNLAKSNSTADAVQALKALKF